MKRSDELLPICTRKQSLSRTISVPERRHSDKTRALMSVKARQRVHRLVTRARLQIRMVAQLHIGAQFRALVDDSLFDRCLRTKAACQLVATLVAHRRLTDLLEQKRKSL